MTLFHSSRSPALHALTLCTLLAACSALPPRPIHPVGPAADPGAIPGAPPMPLATPAPVIKRAQAASQAPKRAIPAVQVPITLLWDYPASNLSTDLVFRVYTSSDLTNWTALATVPGGTNGVLSLQVLPAEAFYYVTASNFWGESLPSAPASTPPIPASQFPLRISR